MKAKSAYEKPESSIIPVSAADILTASARDEGEWDVHSNR